MTPESVIAELRRSTTVKVRVMYPAAVWVAIPSSDAIFLVEQLDIDHAPQVEVINEEGSLVAYLTFNPEG